MCEHAWRKLRSPFVLPPASVGFHECQYESFDMGLAGCLLCGRVHRCSQQLCTRLVQIEDATVCEITGCVVHTHNLVANQFDDTAMLRKPGGIGSRAQPFLHDDVERFVRLLLTSKQSAEAHRLQLDKMTSKMRSLVLAGCAQHASFFSLVESSMSRMQSTRVVPHSFNHAQRETLVAVACQHIAFLLASTRSRMPHMLRGLETRTLVFGLLYLMRTASARTACASCQRSAASCICSPTRASCSSSSASRPSTSPRSRTASSSFCDSAPSRTFSAWASATWTRTPRSDALARHVAREGTCIY